MRIFGSIVSVGVLSVGLVAGVVTAEEVIEVNGCAPGWILMGSGTNWWCVADSSTTTPPGGGGDPGEDGGGDGGGGGGSGGAEPMDWGDLDREAIAEAKKKWRCDQCKNGWDKCKEKAFGMETRCKNEANAQAKWRCNIVEREQTTTAFGCTIQQHRKEICTGTPYPWNDPDRWIVHDAGEILWSPGVFFCEESWAVSHPGGSSQIVDTANFSITFDGLGGGYSRTVNATYNLTPTLGYLAACMQMGIQLQAGCTAARDACYTQYGCDNP
jgi:hypothetical protein